MNSYKAMWGELSNALKLKYKNLLIRKEDLRHFKKII